MEIYRAEKHNGAHGTKNLRCLSDRYPEMGPNWPLSKSVDPWSEFLDPSYRGEGLPSPLFPSLWTCLLTFPPKTLGGNPQTTKPNHLFGQALQKPQSPTGSPQRVPLGSIWVPLCRASGFAYWVSRLEGWASIFEDWASELEIWVSRCSRHGRGVLSGGLMLRAAWPGWLRAAELPPLKTSKPRPEAPPKAARSAAPTDRPKIAERRRRDRRRFQGAYKSTSQQEHGYPLHREDKLGSTATTRRVKEWNSN